MYQLHNVMDKVNGQVNGHYRKTLYFLFSKLTTELP